LEINKSMKGYIKDFNSFLRLNEAIESDPDFVNYIISVEGTGPGSSPEKGHVAYRDIAGVWTIGYGHAETSGTAPRPVKDLTISDAKARAILKRDIADAEKKVRAYIANKFPGKQLDQNQLKMLTDYAFNPGLSKFPSFVKAVVTKDWQKAAQEYKRYSGTKPLTDRNRKFYNLFLAPLLGGKSNDTRRPLTNDEKKKLEPLDPEPDPHGKKYQYQGKPIYPRNTSRHNFANVREEPVIDNGWFDNIISVVTWPKAIGIVIGETIDADGRTWYKVNTGSKTGWVRYDVVTRNQNEKFI
jgi:GH24 family phage-related lysozyme (muramidase)